MRSCFRSSRPNRAALFALSFAFALGGSPATLGESCVQPVRYYQDHNYVVRQLRIDTPLSLIGRVRRQFLPVERALPLQPGEPFTTANFSRGFGQVRDAFGELDVTAGERIRLAVVLPDIENCTGDNAAPPQLDVVYRVYATDTIFALAKAFEGRPDRITRSLAPGAVAETAGKILPQPFIGFNPNRGLFGGTAASFESDTPVVHRVDTAMAVGDGSLSTEVVMSGSRSFARGFVSSAEWRLGHRYADLPAGTPELHQDAPGAAVASVRSAVGFGQISSMTPSFGSLGFVMRFGGALEGGNRSVEGSLAPELVQAARYGALKAFAGTTFNAGRNAFTASYGVQFGSAAADIAHDYTKHLLDAAHMGRILLRPHLPLRVETQVSAGKITGSKLSLPIAERFRGGNTVHDFIAGESWRIRAGPLIRSFPENTLLRTADGAVGGTSFFSLNFTLGVTAWRYPAVPAEIGSDADIRIALVGQMASAKQDTILSYLNETPEFADLATQLGEIERTLLALERAALTALAASPPAPLQQRITGFAQTPSGDPLHTALDNVREAAKDFGNVRSVVIGFPDVAVPSTMEEIETEAAGIAADLKTAGLTAPAAEFERLRSELETQRKASGPLYEAVRRNSNLDAKSLEPPRAILPDIRRTAAEAHKVVKGLEQSQGESTTRTAALVGRYLEAVGDAILRVEEAEPEIAIADLDRLARGKSGHMTEPLLPALARELRSLAGLLPAREASAAARLRTLADEVDSDYRKLRDAVAAIPRPEVERKALRDLAYTGRVLDVVFRELNLFSVSPVFLFDAARIGPQEGGRFGGVRYGIGGGVRFSIVSLDVTVGYSGNPRRKPWEPSGALFFALEVADLFR